MRNSAWWKSGFLTLILFGFAISLTFAQEITVSGTVSSDAEGPIPGVNIVIQGTTQGAVTDVDGNFSITVPGPDAVLVFTSIGYAAQNITVGNQTIINVIMVEDVTQLDEIVVIGYGTQKKKELTSAISNVKAEEFNKGSVNNPAQLVQGKVAGLSISKPGGNPNQGFTMRLRGMSTIGANTQPLVVIDGVVGGSLENVDPNDIESMDVLKDGSAAAIYGTRGSSGVIIVTTKKGRRGTAYIDYNGMVTVETVGKYPNVMDVDQWKAMSAETGEGTDFGFETNWFEETTRNAIQQVHNLSMSGGTEKTTYMASFNFRDGEGVALNTGYNQLNGRLNISQKALNDRLTVDLNIGATQRESQYGFTEAFRYASIYNPTAPVRSDEAQYEQYDGYFQQVLYDYYNPVALMEQNKNEGKDQRVNVALRGTLEIIDGLKVDAFYSVQDQTFQRGSYRDKNSYGTGMNRNGLARRSFDENSFQLFESTLNYVTDISGANLQILGGYSHQSFLYEGFGAQGGDFITDAFTYNNLGAAKDFNEGIGDVWSYKNSNKLIAFFGRVNLNVTDSWFLTASARYEGSSRFGEGNKWGLFPAIGGGVDLANVLDIASMDNLKLRVSYGITGNQPGSSYMSLLRLSPSGNFYYDGEFIPGYAPSSNANEDLGWEKKGEFDVGVDFSMLDGRLFGSFDFYTRTTTDLLFEYEVPVPPNLYSTAWLNLGEIKNSGLELTLTWNAIQAGDFSWSTTITPAYYLKNELVSLSGEFNGAELNYGVRDLGGMGAPGMSDVPLVRAEEGQPIGQLWAHTFVEIDPDGNLILRDTNEDGTVDELDRSVVGNGLPDAEFGWGNNFKYKNFDMNIFFRGVLGHDLNNTFRAFYEVPEMIGSYNLPATATDLRNAETGTLYNASSGVLSSYHIEDASFVSLDNMSIGYNFDVSGSNAFRNIRVFVAGNNLFYITKYKGVDPSPRYDDRGNVLIPGMDRRNTWFRTRSVSLGVNLGF
ncbi:MAG: SusC/RagA family TonB-linked outer membrane protein [Bacteroidales bacterium]|nr:SusC/RagA family TonB-linked outer membrane protein [Bacteroidales bacterium]